VSLEKSASILLGWALIRHVNYFRVARHPPLIGKHC